MCQKRVVYKSYSADFSFIAIDMIAQVASSYFVYWTHKAKDVINAQKYNILKEELLLMEKLFRKGGSLKSHL